MTAVLVALAAGIVFGMGLAVSRMIDPFVVKGFLDFAGAWNATLAFVMAGAVIAAAPGYLLVSRLKAPVLADTFEIPSRRDIDGRLISGAAIFGVGWGLAGLCPGPAIAALSTGHGSIALFFAAMVAGMIAYRFTPWA